MDLIAVIQKVQRFFGEFLQPPVATRPRSSWQERSCINVGHHEDCKKEATLEAFFQRGKLKAAVRHCVNPACQAVAAVIARQAISTKTQS